MRDMILDGVVFVLELFLAGLIVSMIIFACRKIPHSTSYYGDNQHVVRSR